jgi:hypothetical protein
MQVATGILSFATAVVVAFNAVVSYRSQFPAKGRRRRRSRR